MSGYPNILRFFMWSYQVHYRISAQVTAESIFNEIDPQLKPNVFLLGFSTQGNDAIEPICIEPEDLMYKPELFKCIKQRINEKYENSPHRNLIYSDEGSQAEMETRQKNQAFREVVQDILNESSSSSICFVGDAVCIGNYFVMVVLELNKITYRYHTHLEKAMYHDVKIYQSLIETCIIEFLSDQFKALHLPNAGKNLSMDYRSGDDILRAAANSFMQTVAIKGNEFEGLHGLFKACNNISCTRWKISLKRPSNYVGMRA